MKRLPCLLVLLSVIGFFCAKAQASGTDSSFNFLAIGEGARPAGMGEAFTALADDVNALYWNTAGLSAVRSHEVTSTYLKYLVDVNIGYAGYALPAFGGGLGVGVMYVDYGEIRALNYDNAVAATGYYRPYDLVVSAGYGKKLSERLSAGAGVKGIYENIKGYTANAVAADAGVQYSPSVKNLKIGVTLQNMGVQTKAFVDELHSLPLTCRIGAGYTMFDDSLKLAADYYRRGSTVSGLNGGVEYTFRRMVALRCGYQTRGEDLKTGSASDSITGFTAGLGVKYGFCCIDYAFVPYNELGQTHRISLGVRFDGAVSGAGNDTLSDKEGI